MLGALFGIPVASCVSILLPELGGVCSACSHPGKRAPNGRSNTRFLFVRDFDAPSATLGGIAYILLGIQHASRESSVVHDKKSLQRIVLSNFLNREGHTTPNPARTSSSVCSK